MIKRKIALVVIPLLTTLVTILSVIPGEQGETVLQVAIEALKRLVGAE